MRLFTSQAISVLSCLLLFAGCDDDNERRRFFVSVENISQVYDFPASGTFNTPVGAAEAGPLEPGMHYEFEIYAAPGSRLSFATMFVMSNDFFYAPPARGMDLFDDSGQALSGDVTGQVLLWDAGTEINQEPGAGVDQPLNQSGPNTGAADPTGIVRLAPDEFSNLPPVDEVIQVTLTPGIENVFKVRIENRSNETTLQFTGGQSAVVLTPGVWVVHDIDSPLFSPGKSDFDEGLEHLAEDGDAGLLAQSIMSRTGITSPIAPGVFAVHRSGIQPIFQKGEKAPGNGLESLAEDGLPSTLAATLAADTRLEDSGSFEIPLGAVDPAPASSGERYEFHFRAEPGDRLSLATMLVQSNDLFFAFDPEGIPLFNDDREPISGILSSGLDLWDAGTEVNEYPGTGASQAPRQPGPNLGVPEDRPVALVDDGFTYPASTDFLRVTITPLPQ